MEGGTRTELTSVLSNCTPVVLVFVRVFTVVTCVSGRGVRTGSDLGCDGWTLQGFRLLSLTLPHSMVVSRGQSSRFSTEDSETPVVGNKGGEHFFYVQGLHLVYPLNWFRLIQ